MVGNANANGIPFLKENGIPSAIKNSMILWYDIQRQGATNENMVVNPILKDLSGNGHNATCYNFDWAGMSGIGGYSMPNLSTWIKNSMVITEIISDNKIKIVSGGNAEMVLGIRKSYSSNISIKFSFTELASKINIYKNDNTSNTLIQTITEEGEYIFDFEYDADKTYNQIAIAGLGTIEQLPLYPNALVSDGVDDYAVVEGLPILTPERGYTIIAKRKHLSLGGVLASNRVQDSVSGAFAFELSATRTDSFGMTNNVIRTESLISYQSKSMYNGINIYHGTINGVDKLLLFRLNPATMGYMCQSALYSLLLFNRDLTDEEIEWVKNNLINN